MTARWFVVKYIPDLYRREPRNVGVVLVEGELVHVRLLGLDPVSGQLDTASVSSVIPETRTYRAWVEYIVHHAKAGTWPRLLESLSRRPLSNFSVEEGGTWCLAYDDPQELVTELYGSLVDDPNKTKAPTRRGWGPMLSVRAGRLRRGWRRPESEGRQRALF